MIRFSLLIVIISLSACSLQPPTAPSSNSWQQHQQRIAKLQNWKLSGKLGFRTPEEGGSAVVNWTQENSQYQLSLSGAFGIGGAKIYGDDKTAEMLYGDTIYRHSPQQLAMQLTGLPLPVDALSWWARGLPSPTQPAVTDLATGAGGLASGFEQAGWQLLFSRYRETGGELLPGKITGTYNLDSEDRSYSFKLVISSWKFHKKE